MVQPGIADVVPGCGQIGGQEMAGIGFVKPMADTGLQAEQVQLEAVGLYRISVDGQIEGVPVAEGGFKTYIQRSARQGQRIDAHSVILTFCAVRKTA